jgi:hypothetical protein
MKASATALACLLAAVPALAIPETVSAATLNSALPAEWLACRVFAFKNPDTSDRFWSTDTIEADNIRRGRKFTDEGVRGYFFVRNYLPDAGIMVPVHRLYKGHHILTTSEAERTTLVRTHKWEYEGIVGYVVARDRIQDFRERLGITTGSHSPWHRLYHGNQDDHFFTTEDQEYRTCIGTGGFTDEGALGYLY